VKRIPVRRATEADLAAIHVWLKDEAARSVPGNFLCNWSIVEKAQRQGRLLVYIDPISAQPIAFQLGGLINSGILAVRDEYRGKGIGRQLVEYCVRAASKKGEPVLQIQCAPDTSIPFWERMGFVACARETDDSHYRIVSRKLKIPKDTIATKVRIRFYADERKWNSSIAPCETHELTGYRDSNGVIYLSKRVAVAFAAHANIRDIVIEIEVAGQTRYLDKAKYEEAAALGVISARNGYYIDKINVECDADSFE
jgi:GNAT superfamily N-acetyltransferase